MYSVHDSTSEDIGLEKVCRRIRVQLPTTYHRYHCISVAHFPPQRLHHGLHLPGIPLYRPHSDSSQLFAHLRDHTKPETDHQQSEHTLRCYGRIDIDGIQLQFEFERLEFELRNPDYDRATLA